MIKEHITSRKNALILKLADMQRGENDDGEGRFLAEGVKQCLAAKNAGKLYTLFVTEDCLDKNPELVFQDIDTVLVDKHVYERFSVLKNPEGACGLCCLPSADETLESNGKYAVLCDVQNPENVGGIMRSAAAFGYTAVIFCGNTARHTAPKTIRASAGAHFVLPVLNMTYAEFFERAKAKKIETIATTPLAKPSNKNYRKNCGMALLIGNEGAGLTEETINKCDTSVGIEITGMESLNASVAAGILLYEYR